MRPVLLDMDGFASFRDQATVDFTDADYFALVGPTGSGKSHRHRRDDLRPLRHGPALAGQADGDVRAGPDRGARHRAAGVRRRRQRYVVARELRRAKAGGVNSQECPPGKASRPRPRLGTINDLTEVIAADGLVTAAVEKLLGLTFEHFCQCVVLPQGEFAEFLRAKGSERREILLKLLGAGLYKEIGQAANSRASLAGQRANLLVDQLASYLDANAHTEALAAERESALLALTENVELAVPRLRAATDAVAQTERTLAQLTAEHDLLTSIRLPDGINELDTAITTQQQARVATNSGATPAARRRTISTATRESVSTTNGRPAGTAAQA